MNCGTSRTVKIRVIAPTLLIIGLAMYLLLGFASLPAWAQTPACTIDPISAQSFQVAQGGQFGCYRFGGELRGTYFVPAYGTCSYIDPSGQLQTVSGEMGFDVYCSDGQVKTRFGSAFQSVLDQLPTPENNQISPIQRQWEDSIPYDRCSYMDPTLSPEQKALCSPILSAEKKTFRSVGASTDYCEAVDSPNTSQLYNACDRSDGPGPELNLKAKCYVTTQANREVSVIVPASVNLRFDCEGNVVSSSSPILGQTGSPVDSESQQMIRYFFSRYMSLSYCESVMKANPIFDVDTSGCYDPERKETLKKRKKTKENQPRPDGSSGGTGGSTNNINNIINNINNHNFGSGSNSAGKCPTGLILLAVGNDAADPRNSSADPDISILQFALSLDGEERHVFSIEFKKLVEPRKTPGPRLIDSSLESRPVSGETLDIYTAKRYIESKAPLSASIVRSIMQKIIESRESRSAGRSASPGLWTQTEMDTHLSDLETGLRFAVSVAPQILDTPEQRQAAQGHPRTSIANYEGLVDCSSNREGDQWTSWDARGSSASIPGSIPNRFVDPAVEPNPTSERMTGPSTADE